MIINLDSGFDLVMGGRIAAWAYPNVKIKLPRLSLNESEEFVEIICKKLQLDFTPETIHDWAKCFQGYPLMFVDGLRRYQARMELAKQSTFAESLRGGA